MLKFTQPKCREVLQINSKTKEIGDEEKSCKKHPEYNPEDDLCGEFANCEVCNNLHYGSRPVGSFNGEESIEGENVKEFKIAIGPLTLEQFGDVRYSFGFHYYHCLDSFGYFVDDKKGMIYLEEEPGGFASLDKIQAEHKCRIVIRQVDEQASKIEKILTDIGDNSLKVNIAFDDSKRAISFLIKNEMSSDELRELLEKVISKLEKKVTVSISETEYGKN